MPLNNSNREAIAYRRHQVAMLRLRGLTQREIVDMLAREGAVNPETSEPYSLGTINSDIQALEKEWREQAARDTATRRAELLAELRAARRQAWSDKDVSNVLRGIKQEVELFGLDAPKRFIVDWDKLTDDEWDKLAAGVPPEKAAPGKVLTA